jgi:UDP-N-acetylmuramate dehydrogenase
MDDGQRTALSEIVQGRIEFDKPMSQMTTFRVGGNAEAVCFPGTTGEIKDIISYLCKEGINYFVVGKGSNLLVGEEGIKGAVIILKDELASVENRESEGSPLIIAGCGLTIPRLSVYCMKNGFSGLEFMAGIPGTLGGAVFMNAGAYGQEIGSLVREVLAIGKNGETVILTHEDMGFSYRASSLPGGMVICRVTLLLQRGDKRTIGEEIARNLKRRKETQPLDYPSAGSVFKNPPGDYAGRLIEKAGLKGTRVGGAMISPRHGNFIINTGGAKACDILSLIELAKERVKEASGIDLKPEIVILGG